MLFFLAGAILLGVFQRKKAACIFSNMAIPSGIAGSIIALVRRVPHAIWHHGSDVHGGNASGASEFQRALLRVIWKKSDHNLFVSQGLLDMARSYGGVHGASVLPIAPAIGAATDTHVEAREPYYLFLGRMEKVKRPLLLLEAYAALQRQGSIVRNAVMVGDGSLFGALQSRVAAEKLGDRIEVRKNVDHATALSLTRSAYALVICSAIEGLSTTVLEAAQFGVPSIGPDIPGISDFVKHRLTGLLFRENNPGQLAECIKELDQNPALRNELGTSAFESVQRYTITVTADLFEERMRMQRCFQ
jgi:glycosyltransferase involved in cell wall biosynthesis